MKLFLLLILAVGGKHKKETQIYFCSAVLQFRDGFLEFFFIHLGSKGEHTLNMAKVGLLRIVLKHDNGGLNIRQNL